MVKVAWNDEALSDMDEIASYIASGSETYAAIQIETFFDRAEILSRNPRSGVIVPELNDKNVRQLVEGNYRIIYEIKSPTQIEILCIIHGMRLLKRHSTFRTRKPL
jgi:plasmid stabilization system protein ParE